jgi:hypothetical protein
MKRIALMLFAGSAVFLTSCETTKEITLQKDGSGTVVNTTDMSGLLAMAKMSGQANEQLEKVKDTKLDTSFSTESMLSVAPDLTDAEKELVKKGTVGINMNMANEKFIVKLSFPFNNGNEIQQLDKLSSQVITQVMKGQMDSAAKNMPADMDKAGLPKASIDDYYEVTYSKGVIEKKLNKEKYANVNSDEEMKSLKEMSGMGGGNNTVIINLPSPAKKAVGKKVTLSEDKKKVTIVNSADDFFDDGASLEYRIEY